MRFSPTEQELLSLENFSGKERLEYFITRTGEAEEVWGLGNDSGWVMREMEGITSLPVWPYRQLALESAEGEWQEQVCNAISLEHFVFSVLGMLVENEIKVEIMPGNTKTGYLVNAGELFRLYESMFESGEYFIEG